MATLDELRSDALAAPTVRADGAGPHPLPETASPHEAAPIPAYLAGSYWWAYLAPPAVWFFDHQPIINAILLGQYRRLMHAALAEVDPERAGRTLQLAAVYGVLTPTLAQRLPPEALHLIDVASIQLEHARRKAPVVERGVALLRMNAERLAYASDSFDTVLLYFLLHELPPAARARVLAESIRVLRPGGTLVIADYGELAAPHPLHRIALLRLLAERLEPYLADFWRQRLDALVAVAAAASGKHAACQVRRSFLAGFYRVCRYRLGGEPDHLERTA